jgi:DNA polymerase III subunit delta'
MMLHDVVGHEALRDALAGSQRASTLPSALLFQGPRGVGKQRLALWLGQLVLCESPVALEVADGGGPCGKCRSCRMVLRLEHPDLHWYFPVTRPRSTSPDRLADALEEARFQRLAELREEPVQASGADEDPGGIYLAAAQALRRRAQSRPSMSPEQYFIIADAEQLVPQESSPEAANALLKLLEEPPADTRLVLTSSEPGSLLDTIRSRSVPVHVPPLAVEQVEGFLRAHRDADPEAVRLAARLGQGSIGRALGFLPADDGSPGPLEVVRRDAYRVLEAALVGAEGYGFSLALGYKPTRARALLEMLAAVEDWLRDLAAVAAGVPEKAVAGDAVQALTRLVERESVAPEAVARALPAVDEAALHARGNVNPQLIVAGLVAALRIRLRGRG